jgi:glycosyltransferase involved in cell wall biosynthesis
VNLAIKTLNMRNTHEIINICEPLSLKVESMRLPLPIPSIGMVGRVSNQKGFQFYAEVAMHFKGKVQFVWIGGGDAEKEKVLKDAGVIITGWSERKEVLAQIASLDLYFHSAAWEGFPISVLEAAMYDVPVLLRGIGPFVDENLFSINNTDEAKEFISRFIKGDVSSVKTATDTTLRIKNYHTELNLKKSLSALYG